MVRTPQAASSATRHLQRTIDLQANHTPARLALGFRQFGDTWITHDELMNAEREAEARRQAIKKYGRQIESIVQELSTAKTSTLFDHAKKQLNAIDDPQAIQVVEVAFGATPEPLAIVALEWLSKFDQSPATLALARFAVFHGDESVRHQAAQRLQQRELHTFVPQLLQIVSSPIHVSTSTWFRPDGGLAIRQEFTREGRDQIDFLLVNSLVKPNRDLNQHGFLSRDNSTLRTPEGKVVAEFNPLELELKQRSARESLSRQQIADQQNQSINSINQRVAKVLSSVSGTTIEELPAAMWRWWDELNESSRPALKKPRYVRLTTEQVYRVMPARLAEPQEPRRQQNTATTRTRPRAQRRDLSSLRIFDCFAEGTPIITRYGRKAD